MTLRFQNPFNAKRFMRLASGCLGVSFASLSLFAFAEAQREYSLFRSIVKTEMGYEYELDSQKEIKRISSEQFSSFSPSVRLMNATYLLLRDRGQALSAREYPLRQRIYSSGLDHLQSGMGACASFAWVLAELLQVAGYESRMAQLRCRDQPLCYCGPEELCHTVVEVLDSGRWVVLDPVRNLFYLNSYGHPASLSEIRNGSAAPFLSFGGNPSAGYKYVPLASYSLDEASVVYTNWSKLPVVGSALYRLSINPGSLLHGISLRSQVLNCHLAAGVLFLVLSVFFFSLAVALGRGETDL